MGTVRSLKKFGKSRGGNVAMMTALFLPSMILLLGGALDFIRVTQMKAEIQGAIDAAVLALSELGNDSDPEETMRDFLEANLDTNRYDVDKIVLDVTANQHLNSRTVSVDATYPMKTYFLGMIGRNKVDLQIHSSGIQSYQDVEISMVLDISSSMNNTKLSNLKSASKEFIDTVLTDSVRDMTSINIVPFGGTVNLGAPGLYLADPSDIDPNDDDNHSDGHYWRGCVEIDKNHDYDDGLFVHSSYPVVPHFWKWNSSNPWCPDPENSVVILSNNNDELKEKIEDFSRSDGTGMDIGTAFGVKFLSPDFRPLLSAYGGGYKLARPANYKDKSLKALVIMTDGEITAQFRPKDGCSRANGGCQDTLYNYNKAKSNFVDLCDEAKDNGIIVYTIGFQIKKSNDSHTLLGNCATTPGHYYFVETTDISSAFKSIAASINAVRLTK